MGRHSAKTPGGAVSQAGAGDCAQPAARTGFYNYCSDAGGGSATFTQGHGAGWRAALLGTVAAGALFLGYGGERREPIASTRAPH